MKKKTKKKKKIKKDGFRIDAVKHFSASFQKNWLNYLRKECYEKKIFSVGEYFSYNINEIKEYIKRTNGTTSVFDFILRENMYNIAFYRSSFKDILKNTVLNFNEQLCVTFVENHDTQIAKDGNHGFPYWFKFHGKLFKTICF